MSQLLLLGCLHMQTDIVERPVKMILVARVVGLVMDARSLRHPAIEIKS
jgi:hypothetical protein